MWQINRTATGSEPVTLTEAKTFLKVDYTTHDDLLTSLIKSAREQAEKFCNRSFIAQTIELSFDWDGFAIKLPYPNHSAISSVKVNDVVTTAYTKKGLNQFEIDLTSAGIDDEILITYTTTADCPEQVKTAIKKMVAKAYSPDIEDNGYSDLQSFRLY